MEGTAPSSEKSPVTFSLATAFFVLAVLCLLLAEYQAAGTNVVPLWLLTLLATAAYVMHRACLWIGRNLAVAVFLITGFFTMLPQLCGPRWVWTSSECSSRMKTIALAAHDYHYRNGTLPPHNQANDGASPGLSWRIMLLPFLEQDTLYKKFDLQSDWQSAANRPLANVTVREFRCPAERNNRNNETSYVAITGDDTCWPTSNPISFANIKDGTSYTVLFTETHDSGILWPEPRDLEYDKLDWRIHGTPGNSISSSHGPYVQYFDGSRKLTRRTSVNVALADGSVLRLSLDVDPEVLKQMANRRDGQPKELP
jgi:hypothetical protein